MTPYPAYFTSKLQSWEIVAGMPVQHYLYASTGIEVVLHKPGMLQSAWPHITPSVSPQICTLSYGLGVAGD